MNSAILTAAIGVVGVIVGVVLNELAAVFRQRREDKRQLKIVLFGLLNIRHYMAPPDVDVLIRCLDDWARSNGLGSIGEADSR